MRILILLAITMAITMVITTLLLASSTALASGQSPPAGYVVERGAASGESYHLTSLAWQATSSRGAGYRLLSLAAPLSSENGCCCNYLPCMLRNSP